jgi:hypothetical protein
MTSLRLCLAMFFASAAAPIQAQMHASSNGALHLQLTPIRPVIPGDSARADTVLASLRAALVPYRDVHTAEADGYRIFLPRVPQPVYHFTSWRRAFLSAFRFDPTRPSTLLYRRTPAGGWELAGAMYSAPGRTDLTSLNARVPLGIARWHRHVSWCLPPPGERRRWGEMRDGQPVFGPGSPITTESECRAVGGIFHRTMFGWMVHVNPFAASPTAIWGEHGH